VATITSTAAFWRRRRDAGRRGQLPFGRGRRSRRRQERFAVVLDRPEQATLRALATVASGSEAAICDLGAAVDGVWTRLLATDRDMLGYHLRAAGIAAMLRRASRSWVAGRRLRAASAMGDLRLAECARGLDRMVHDRNPHVRCTAVRALGRLETAEAARLLIGALEQGAVPEHELVKALGAPYAVRPLLQAFRAPRTMALRAPLADALGRTGSAEATEALVAAMSGGGSELRVRLVRALTRIGSSAAVGAVRAAMSDPHGRVRAQAAWSLARLGDAEATVLLERGLADSAPWVRANCTAALRQLARTDDLPAQVLDMMDLGDAAVPDPDQV
jgi:HEAT repeat protein